jgi:hypothetical protein
VVLDLSRVPMTMEHLIFDINLSVGGDEKNVHPRRIQNSTPLATTARRRSIAGDSATRLAIQKLYNNV